MTELGNSPRALGLAEVLNAEGVKADRQEHFQRALDEGGEDLRTVVEHLVGEHPGLDHIGHFAEVRAETVPLLLGAARVVATTGIEFDARTLALIDTDSHPEAGGPLASVTLGDDRVVAEVRALADDE